MCRHFKHLFLLLGMLGCGSAKDGASVSPSSDTATANDSAAPPSDPDVECIPELSADHPAPEFSAVFLETCAGCHGADGLGQGAYPSMKGLSLEGILDVYVHGNSWLIYKRNEQEAVVECHTINFMADLLKQGTACAVPWPVGRAACASAARA